MRFNCFFIGCLVKRLYFSQLFSASAKWGHAGVPKKSARAAAEDRSIHSWQKGSFAKFMQHSAWVLRIKSARLFGKKVAVFQIFSHCQAMLFPWKLLVCIDWDVSQSVQPEITAVELIRFRHSCSPDDKLYWWFSVFSFRTTMRLTLLYFSEISQQL